MLNLHANVRGRLLEITTAALPTFQVVNGTFLRSAADDPLAAADAALDGNTKKELRKAISEHPFSDFVTGHLQDELAAFKYERDAPIRPLMGMAGFEDPNVVATRLVDAFTSLPWRYSLICPLGLKSSYLDDAPEGDKEYQLGDTLFLVRPGPAFAAKYAAAESGGTLEEILAQRMLRYRPLSWNSKALYLVNHVEGFLTGPFDTQLAKNCRLLVRALGGLLEASLLTDYHYSTPAYWEGASPGGRIYIFWQQGDQFTPANAIRFDSDHDERLSSLQWRSIPQVQEHQWDIWMKYVAGALRPAFEEPAALLRSCSQWFFDSQCGTNWLLQYIQATVAVETLLGDKATSDKVGLGELLSSRCAYSIARTPQERQQLLEDFKEIYDTRSKIVHRGHAELSDSELNQLGRLKQIARRLIFKELELLKSRNEA